MIQIPSPELATEVGVVGWCLMVLIVTTCGGLVFFLRRMVRAMDRMALAQEAGPPAISQLSLQMNSLDAKLTELLVLAREHVRIARMWEQTEAPGRVVREDPPDSGKR